MDQCDTTVGPKTKFGEYTDTATNITGLQAYSTYTVFVSSENSAGSTESNTTATTAQAGKILILVSVYHAHTISLLSTMCKQK